LTLGGGLGYLTRKHGLTIDNLLAADVVLADGSFVTASAEEKTTCIGAYAIHTDYAGPMLWPLERAAEIMRWYREFITTASEEINGFFAFLSVPPGPPFPEHLHLKNMCGIVWCYAGALGKRLLGGIAPVFGGRSISQPSSWTRVKIA
jgi:hypothetical protein